MKFKTIEIIAAGTGIMTCELDGIYKVMNYLTGESLFTHQLPRAFQSCSQWVRQQHPWINDVDTGGLNGGNYETWKEKVESEFGLEHDLEPVPKAYWMNKNPVQELEQMIGKEKVITL